LLPRFWNTGILRHWFKRKIPQIIGLFALKPNSLPVSHGQAVLSFVPEIKECSHMFPRHDAKHHAE